MCKTNILRVSLFPFYVRLSYCFCSWL